jgi:hypothetical protein
VAVPEEEVQLNFVQQKGVNSVSSTGLAGQQILGTTRGPHYSIIQMCCFVFLMYQFLPGKD